MLITCRLRSYYSRSKKMNRHWSVFYSSRYRSEDEDNFYQLRRSKLSKRRILLRNDRSILLDKKNHSTERIERLNSFDLDISQFNSLSCSHSSQSENQFIVTIHKERLNFFEAKQTNLLSQSKFPSHQISVTDFYQDVNRNFNQLLSLWFWR